MSNKSKSCGKAGLRFHIRTFGCQMNMHDSEKIAGVLTEAGYCESSGSDDADVIVLNTCSIREKAEQKFFSELGRLGKAKEKNPRLKIAVAGCIARQRGKDLFRRFPYVDFVFGPDNIDNIYPWIMPEPAAAQEATSQSEGRATAIEYNPEYSTKKLPVKREGQVRAWVSIMYGCDNFCAYCVVPYTRGRERSRPTEDICDEIKSLADGGFREVTLLGQNVNSYGKKLSGESCDFPGLLYRIHDIDGIERIRFVTSHPRDFSEKLIKAMRDLPKVCEHLHLPLQSGSDKILQLMNRGYTYEDYKRKIDDLRNNINNIAITTDIIVGFPGESDEDFQRTADALDEIGFDGIFAFKYSRRPGTKALELPGHLDERVKSQRLSMVLKLQEAVTSRKNKSLEGGVYEVLVEGKSATDGDRLTGRTRTNKIVNFYGERALIGSIVRVKILEAKQHSLYGEAIQNHS